MPNNIQQLTTRANNQGIQVSKPTDRLSPAHYLRLQNVRSYLDGIISTRPGLSPLTALPITDLIHSMRMLNVDIHSQWRLFLGAGSKLYFSDYPISTLTEIDSGYDGLPLSFVPHRPEQSPEPWFYIASSTRMRKSDYLGNNYQMGVSPPNSPPTVEISQVAYNIIESFETLGGWAPGGTSGAITVNTRLTAATTISKILYDTTSPGFASVVPSILDDNLQPGMFLIADAGGPNEETIRIEAVYSPIPNTMISSIVYDVGVNGLCTIQLATPAITGLARNALLNLDPGGASDEIVRIMDVTTGPDGLSSVRVSTNNTHSAATVVNGIGSFRAYFTLTQAPLVTLQANKFAFQVTIGTGYIEDTPSISLATVLSRPVSPDDYIYIALRLDDPSKLLEARLMFDIDANVNDFTRNYLFYPISPNDLTLALQGVLTVRDIYDRDPWGGWRGSPYPYDPNNPDRFRMAEVSTSPPDPSISSNSSPIEAPLLPFPDIGDPEPGPGGGRGGTTPPPPPQTTPGNNQWTTLRIRVGDLQRVGQDNSRSLADVAAIRISFQTSGTLNVDVDSLWIGGTYGPDVTGGTPYQYCYVARSKATGAKSNPSPPTRSGISPHRERVVGTLSQHSDPQVTALDIYRRGGILPDWHFVTTINNTATPTFTDDYSDTSVVNNPLLEFDNFQPFPSIDLPRSGSCNTSGTRVRWRFSPGGDLFNSRWGRMTLIRINGYPYTLYAQPTITTLVVTDATNATPIVITTSTPHGLRTGDGVVVENVGGNTAANGQWNVTVISSTTFSLDFSVGNGVYTAGGTVSIYNLETNENVGSLSAATFEIPEGILLAQPLPVMWGPYGGGLGGIFMFACGDPNLPGVLFVTKGNSPDSSNYRLEITSGSEQLMNGCIYDGRPYVFSTERMYGIEPVNGGADWIAREVANSIGLFSRYSLCVGDVIYFIGKDGIYASEGGQPRCITDESFYNLFVHDAGVATISDNYGIQQLPFANPDDFRLTFFNNHLVLDYKQGLTYNTLIYNTKTNTWSQDIYSPQATLHYGSQGKDQFTFFVAGEDKKLYNLSSISGTDAGVPFQSRVTTSFNDLGDWRTVKTFQEVILDCDTGGGTLNLNVHLDDNTSPTETIPILLGAGRTRVTNDLSSGAGYQAGNLGLDITWTGTPAKLYGWDITFYPQTQKTALRYLDWDDAGTTGDKWVMGVIIDCNTYGLNKTLRLEHDNLVDETFTINTPVRGKVTLSLATPIVAKLLRITTSDIDPWMPYSVQWVFEPYVEAAHFSPPWDTLGDPGVKRFKGILVFADTAGANVSLQLYREPDTLHATLVINSSTPTVLPFELTPFISHLVRVVPLSSDPSIRILGIKWLYDPIPELAAIQEDYSSLDHPGEKRFKGITIEADTLGSPVNFQIQRNGSSTVLQTLSVTLDGRNKATFELTPFNAFTIRALPTSDCRLYTLNWLYDPIPESSALVEDFSALEHLGNKQIRGVVIEADTLGFPIDLQLQGDGGAVLQTLAINHNGRSIKPYELGPFQTSHARLVPLADMRLYSARFILDPYPDIAAIHTDWSDHNDPSAKYIRALLIEADTSGVAVNIDLLADGSSIPFDTLTINHNGRSIKPYPLTPAMVAYQTKLAPQADLQHFRYWPVYDKWPDLLATPTSWGGLDSFNPRWLQGFILLADTGGVNVSVNVETDGGVVSDTLIINHNGMLAKDYSLTDPIICHTFRLVPASPLRLMSIEWKSEPEPPAAKLWKTQPTTHGFTNFHHRRDTHITLRSTATVTFRVTVDGVNFDYSIPSTGGAQQTIYLPLASSKGREVQYSLFSAADFRLYLKDSSIRVKQWGQPGPYTSVRAFGAEHNQIGAVI